MQAAIALRRDIGPSGARADLRRPAVRPTRPAASSAPRFLFEEAAPDGGRSAILAVGASVILHLPLLLLVGLFAPPAQDSARYRNVTAVFDALAEADRVVLVDLTRLGGGERALASPVEGPAPGTPALSENPAAHGAVSSEVPDERRDDAADPGRLSLAAGLRPPKDLAAGFVGGGSGLTPLEERAMRRKWFLWYRLVLGERIRSTYPRARLESRGVRGNLTFRLVLAPDGAVKSWKVTKADSPLMKPALERTLGAIRKFPGYAGTGLDFFPPFVFSIHHGPREWKTLSAAR